MFKAFLIICENNYFVSKIPIEPTKLFKSEI